MARITTMVSALAGICKLKSTVLCTSSATTLIATPNAMPRGKVARRRASTVRTVHKVEATPNLINMDGIEWSRAKWGPVAKTWFWLNDWAGCWLGNHLVADHPQIKVHLQSRVTAAKITVIPYGADAVTWPDVLEQYESLLTRYLPG